MSSQIHWERSGYESRVDFAADALEEFVAAVLSTIDVEAVRASPPKWEAVCRFFAGAGRAAQAQGKSPREGGRQIAAWFEREYPTTAEGSNDGFFEFMDWLSNSETFQPEALRAAVERA